VFVRIVCADVQSGARQTYIDQCASETVQRMKEDHVYLGHHICDSLDAQTDTVVFATVWEADSVLQAFFEKYMPGVNWNTVTVLPWEAGIVVSAEVYYVEDTDFSRLVTIWRTLSSIVRQRSALPPSPLTDAQWLVLQPVLYHQERRGRRRIDNRPIFDVALDVILRGTDWSKGRLPSGASVPTVWRRVLEWESTGAWELAWAQYLDTLEAQERVIVILNFLDCSHPPKRRR
jgi:putative transposase of IS4/5 family DUF4096